MSALFAVVTGGADQWHYVPATQAFGVLNSPTMRADMIARAAEAFFMHIYSVSGAANVKIDTTSLEDELKQILGVFTGWMARRNDVAHGYVTESHHPDYEVYEQPFVGGEPLITTYSLCPSHGNSRKWHLETVEPAYHYRASEIDKFADAFEALDERVSNFSARLDQWRKETIAKLPQQ